jgi:hypothetical protein
MEQILARLLAEMNAMQERMEAKIDANQEIMADLKIQRGCLASRIEVNQERRKPGEKRRRRQEAMEACPGKAKANPEKMKAAVDVFEEMLDKLDTTDLEANPEEKETVA